MEIVLAANHQSHMASQITDRTTVWSTDHSCYGHGKHQSFASQFLRIRSQCRKYSHRVVMAGKTVTAVHARLWYGALHYSDVIMRTMASQITGVSVVCSTVCSGTDRRIYHSSALLVFVRRIHRRPVSAQRASNAEKVPFLMTSPWGIVHARLWYGTLIIHILVLDDRLVDGSSKTARWIKTKPKIWRKKLCENDANRIVAKNRNKQYLPGITVACRRHGILNHQKHELQALSKDPDYIHMYYLEAFNMNRNLIPAHYMDVV